MFKTYYQLAKPGIIYGNLMTAAAGFFLAARGHLHPLLLLALLSGTGLVIASACVTNNIIDRRIDRLMERTSRRALVTGEVTVRSATIYVCVLFTAGLALLVWFTNLIVVIIGAVAWVDYVLLYGVMKRRFVAGTLVGSVSGAAPIVAGYVAITDHLDLGALLLFLILVTWQMAHFYAIAMFRRDDYASAGVPVLTVKRDFKTARIRILAYIVGFTLLCVGLTLTGYTGIVTLVVSNIIGVGWLLRGLFEYHSLTDRAWGRRMFLTSLTAITVISLALAFGSVIP